MPTAIVTGGTLEVIVDAGASVDRQRDVEQTLSDIRATTPAADVIGIAGDITDAVHRSELARAIGGNGLDVLINNAGALGPTPLPRLVDVAPTDLSDLFETNVVAPLRLVSGMLTSLRRGAGIVVKMLHQEIDLYSDAAVEAYAGWGPYGASKAALDHASNVLAAEHPDLGVYAFDPGDMRTDMHQAAFPGEDITDRPLPETVVPKLMRLVKRRPPSGRYTHADLSMRPALR